MTKTAQYTIITFIYICATYLLMFVLDPQTVDSVTAEDRYFEYAGALALLLASLAFGGAFYYSGQSPAQPQFRRPVYLLFAALFFFGAGEEISWGQRLLSIETPAAMSAANAKNEIQ
jgi:hypothetical protein